jgi:hypothetical protein
MLVIIHVVVVVGNWSLDNNCHKDLEEGRHSVHNNHHLVDNQIDIDVKYVVLVVMGLEVLA